jgi:RNA polymerase primary sigma factor
MEVMGRFRIAQVGELARQMEFTPTEGRLRQILAAEELLLQLDPTKAYPFDFVVYRITGYHPKTSKKGLLSEEGFTGHLLTGLALLHDLGLLIEQVSESLRQCVAGLDEPVLSIDEVSQKFNVTSKTIQRWRRRGLAARRFVYPDGKMRLGFLTASVERFFAAHSGQIAQAANFSPLDAAERERIARMARRLLDRGCCAREITVRIGRKLHRSPMTVGYVLGPSFLASAAALLDQKQVTEIAASFSGGTTLEALAAKLSRPRSTIYFALMKDRVERLSRRKIKFIDDPLYHQPAAADAVRQIAAAQELPLPARPEDHRLPRDLPPYLQSLYRIPLLAPSRERALFLKLHFHKFQFVTLRRKLDGESPRSRDLAKLEAHLSEAAQTKNQIVAANLRLVVSVARRHLSNHGPTLMDLVSDGNVTLLRATEAFDVHRGYRFSTYATLALMKEFASCRRDQAKRYGRGASILEDVADPRSAAQPDHVARRDQVQQLLSRLEDRERAVLRAHYGLAGEKGGATYEEVGREMGLSKQSVRRIELAALAKLRASAKDAIA